MKMYRVECLIKKPGAAYEALFLNLARVPVAGDNVYLSSEGKLFIVESVRLYDFVKTKSDPKKKAAEVTASAFLVESKQPV